MNSSQIVLHPKRPNSGGWSRCADWTPPPQLGQLAYPIEAYSNQSLGLFVLSAVEVASEPGEPELGPEYHLSISKHGQRCSAAEAAWALGQFDLLDAKEDNHVPGGRVRNFWRPVADRLSGYECHCVDSEPAIYEDKGDFVWRGITK